MHLHRSIRPLAAAAAGLLLLAGCGDDDSAGTDEDVTVEDVTEEPGLDFNALGEVVTDGDQYLGQEVMVSGEVTAQVDDRVFHIASEPGTNGLLIVSEQPIVDRLDSDDVVEVVGTVREVSPSTFETEFGLPFDDDYDSFGGRHAILATSVEVVGQADDEVDAPAEGDDESELDDDEEISDLGEDEDIGDVES